MSEVIEQPRYFCALGAQQTVVAIPRAHPIIHAGPGCSAKAFNFASFDAGFQGEGFAGGANISCTNTSEQEVVFGGEENLRKTIQGALKILDGDLFVVLSGCTSDIVGDDSVGVAVEFAQEGRPVVGVETAGFKGNNYYGHEVIMNAIIEQFVGTITPRVQKGLVNVISEVPFQNPFWRRDLQEIKSLLESIGLTVNILFGSESEGVKEWKTIPNAEFNLLLSPWVGESTVKLLEKKYGTPYLYYPVLPVGALETSKFLTEVASFAKIENEKVQKVIQRKEKTYYDYFVSIGDFISEYRNNLPSELYVVADATYAIGISNFLVNELGLLPQGIYITDHPKKEKERELIKILEAKGEEFVGKVVIETDGGAIQERIRTQIGDSKKAIIMGSTWEKYLAEEKEALYVYISLPLNETVILNRGFVGYNGGLQLAEEVYRSLFERKTTTARTQLF